MKLDIACKNGKQLEYTGIDSVKSEHVDIVHDLKSFPWPIDDNSVEEIHCANYLAIVPNLEKFMEELYRICKPDAVLRFMCPYYTSVRASANPELIRQISEYTFMFFGKEFRKVHGLVPYEFDFQSTQASFKWQEPWSKKSEEAKEYARTHYWNVVEDIMAEIKAIK